MNIEQEIKNWGAAFLPENVFVVDVEYKSTGRKLAVFLDADDALTIEQCRLFNRHISEKLDEVDFGETPYTLEVSSPGVDRPLVLPRQFFKHMGREVKVRLLDNSEFLGKITIVNENGFTIILKDEKKGYNAKTMEEKEIIFSELDEAVVQINFN